MKLQDFEEDFSSKKQPMKRQKPGEYVPEGGRTRFKDDKRKRREAFERKRGG